MGALGTKSLSIALLLAVACARSELPALEHRPARAPASDGPRPATSALARIERSACSSAAGVEPIELPPISQGSAENLRAWVAALAGPELRGRRAGTADALRAARMIAEQFARLGASAPDADGYCVPFVVEQARDQNVIAHLPPKTEGCRWVVLGAHYDALGVDDAGRVRPGADDDASGIAVMLEVARLVASSLRRPAVGLVLAAFGAEEQGMLGSQAYVAQPSVPLRSVALMINVDMAGRRPGGRYPSVGWEASGPERRATATLVRLASKQARVGAIPMRLGDRGDSASFAPHVPTLFFSTAVHPDYHQPTDTPERVDYGQVERMLAIVLEVVERVACEKTSDRLP
jgi:hypothetical protein